MARIAFLASLTVADARLYAEHDGTHCYAGHGGTPLSAQDTPMKNVTVDQCTKACDNAHKCEAVSLYNHNDRYSPFGDCYLRSAVNLSQCDTDIYHSKWLTYMETPPPPLTGLITYHLFESKYTGLSNKDAGDFKGDAGFIFETFSSWSKGNPEASLEHNILEMNEVNVTGWGRYEQCNAPGAHGHFDCAKSETEYCCTIHDPKNHSHNIPCNHTRAQLPGIEIPRASLGPQFGSRGWWFSFPDESENVTWTAKLRRRIAGKCLGDAWRKDAGGCTECGQALDQCVATCVKAALCPDGSTVALQKTWDRVFSDPKECPDVPFVPPGESGLIVV